MSDGGVAPHWVFGKGVMPVEEGTLAPQKQGFQ